MVKSYVIVIFDKNNKVKSQKFCNNIKECENYLYNQKEKIENFEIYKEIGDEEVLELLKLCMKRLVDDKKRLFD